MCGILGLLPPGDQIIFEKALNELTHRGPDGFGIETIPGQIMLGHRRLAIIDLSLKARQPMFDETRRYCIVFNGEIYNYKELRHILEKKGVVIRSQSDTEVFLYAYILWGPNCVLKCNGMWAVAIWDAKKRQLFLSRDRFGKKPLFYAHTPQGFVFASEMKAIFPFLQDLRPSPDFSWLQKNFMVYETTETCLIDGIHRFQAGHNGVYHRGKLQCSRYWNTLDHLVTIPNKYSAQVEEFRHIFFDAVKIRMRSDVSLGTALSGGLDSSAILTAMAQIAQGKERYQGKSWQNAFVATFPGTPLDESYYANLAAEHVGVYPKFLDINPLGEWDHLFDYLYQFEELYLTNPLPMMMLYQFVKENDVTVTIDGHGADELFSGYGHILEAVFDSGLNPRKIKAVLDIYQGTRMDFSQLHQESNLEILIKFIKKKLLGTIRGTEKKSQDYRHPQFRRLDHLSKALYTLFHETTLPTLLRNYDRYSMANGVEIRMPFMDYRIVCFLMSLPYTSKLGNEYTKRLLRDAMQPYLPPEITWRKSKIGFNAPMVNWMQNQLKDWFIDLVHSQDFIESNLVVNAKKVKEKTLKIISGKDNDFLHAEAVWTDIAPYLWEKAVLKRPRV